MKDVPATRPVKTKLESVMFVDQVHASKNGARHRVIQVKGQRVNIGHITACEQADG